MIAILTNPQRFMALSAWAAPTLGAIAAVLGLTGLWFDFIAPPDYQQGYTVHLMFIHVPAAWLSLFVYVCLGAASFIGRRSLTPPPAPQRPWALASPSWPWPPDRCGGGRCGGPGGCGTRA